MTIKRDIMWCAYKFDFQKHKELHELESENIGDFEDELDSIPTLLQTPFGAFHVDDSMNPFKRFEFWMGHTSFPITEEIKHILDNNIEGIEVLLIITKYRFIVACGEIFNFPDVRIEIERALCGKHKISSLLDEISNETINEAVTNVYHDIKQHKFWAIYVFPNGRYTSIADDTKSTNFLRQQSLYQYAEQISHGILITSEDEHD